MTTWFGVRSWVLFALVAGTFVLTTGVMLAEPGGALADNCDTRKCERREHFYEESTGRCFTFETKDCAWC